MDIWTFDIECYFDNDYTLKKMTTEAFCRDKRFELHMLGVRTPEGVTHWVEGPVVGQYLSLIDQSKAAVLCHHAQFDLLVLNHLFGFKPAVILDTLSMARLMLGNHVSAALGSLTKHYGLPDKSVPYDKFKGVRWVNMPMALREELGDGCVHDVELTWTIFEKLLRGETHETSFGVGSDSGASDLHGLVSVGGPGGVRNGARGGVRGRSGYEFPLEELQTIDWTVRCFTEPQLIGDVKLFERVQIEEWTHQDDLLHELGVTKKDIGSNEKFIKLLEAEGVEIEYKQGTNGPIPAFAKTDDFMKELQDAENPRVATLADTRLSVRSTIDETRAGRLADMARRGPLPIYLGYCSAHTTRWSGGDRVNFQNFPRRGDIRKGVRAPEGSLIAVFDYSQIEARILNHVAGQTDICEAFASGRDLYSEGASRFYARPINKKDNPTERHLGKVLELGCGYGMGATKLRATCRAGALGGPPILLTDLQAQAGITSYRTSHPKVVDYWREGNRMLSGMASWYGRGGCQWGPMYVEGGRIILPNGAPMHYHLEWDEDERTWRRQTRTGWRKMWGGSLVENVVQAMARVVMSQAAIRVKKLYHILPVWTVHDELVYVLPTGPFISEQFAMIRDELKGVPDWLVGCPLDVEGGLGTVYGEIK